MSLPERLLWNELRGDGLRIRRQHPLGPYILDFYCPSVRVAIEIDGIAHDMGDRPRRDEIRSAWIEAQGRTLVRISASEVLRDPTEVAEGILAFCRSPPPRR